VEHRLRVTKYLKIYVYCRQHAGKEICKIVGSYKFRSTTITRELIYELS